MRSASSNLSSGDFALLSDLDFTRASERVAGSGFLSEYYSWEVALRNQVMLQRLKRVEQRGAPLHSGASGSNTLAVTVEQLFQQEEPLVIEQGLEQLRWHKLDELCGPRLFDMVFLAVYVLKLQILERVALWQKEAGRDFYEKVSKEIVEEVGEV
ncbi:MAG: DUF2764 family protein [Spirochaetota bacterium]